MTWNDNLKIGIPAIDTQHKMLCDMTDNFLDACKSGKGRQEIVNLISFLEQYTIRHFHDEEIVQKQSGYPKFEEHKAIHEAFIKKVHELKEEIVRDGVSIVTVGKINSVVVDWLLNHIKKEDQELGRYINKK
jgi:hemerythrin